MVDFVQDIGGSSTMMIRDLGGTVEFWFKTGPQTWNNQQPWSFFVNGASSGMQYFRLLRGGNWQKFGAVYVGYDQDVGFTIYNSGLGFPTFPMVAHITRTTVPPPPNLLSAQGISTTHIHVVFTSTGDGGSPVLEWQIGYGGSGNAPSFLVGSSGTSDVGPFVSGQLVYFWARGRNAVGWSAWSNRRDASTWRVPDAPTAPQADEITQTSMSTQFFGRGNGGTAFTDHQLGYGTNPSAPTTFVNNITGINDLTGLDPGKVYYLWARSQNSVGWSPWSARTTVVLIAGARVLVGGQYKRAVPYVKVAGVWRLARPWVRDAGVWKETAT